jgi:uncharacterized DUF497 family protein
VRLFQWDPVTAASNLCKHGVSFEDAVSVFDDPLADFEQDRIVDGESRWQVIGVSRKFTLTVVAHATWTDEDTEIIRIISARRAEKHERERYEG